MLFAADDSVSGTFVCFDFAKSSDCGSVFFGFMRGKKEGMFIGFFRAFDRSVLLRCPGLLYALLYMYVGYVNGFSVPSFFRTILLPMLLISASDLVCNLCIYFFRFLFRKQFDIGYYFFTSYDSELVYTLLVTILLYWLILKDQSVAEKNLREKE